MNIIAQWRMKSGDERNVECRNIVDNLRAFEDG